MKEVSYSTVCSASAHCNYTFDYKNQSLLIANTEVNTSLRDLRLFIFCVTKNKSKTNFYATSLCDNYIDFEMYSHVAVHR